MRSAYRFLAALIFGLLTLTACSPSADKPSAVKPSMSEPVAAAPAASQPAETAPQPPAPAGAQNSGQYATLATAQPVDSGNKVTVLEFFGYFCSHCRALDPMLGAWVKKQGNRISFQRVPVQPDEAKLYYTLEAMGQLEALHEKIFDAEQVEHLRLNSASAAADFAAKYGIDKNKFIENYNSFSVQSKVLNVANLTKAYQVDGVPMIAIDGRFITSASHVSTRPGVEQTEAGLHAAVLQVMDELVAKVRKERNLDAKTPHTAKTRLKAVP